MTGKTKIYIAATGMITSVGVNTAMTTAAVRAGINAYQESAYYNKQRKLMKMALVPDDALPPLNENLSSKTLTARQRRMLRLTLPPLVEVLQNHQDQKPIPLFLSVPESIPNSPAPNFSNFVQLITEQTGVKFDLDCSRVFATGRVGGLHAVEMAFRYFAASGKEYALVGGVDSCIDLAWLHALDQQDRIVAEELDDGFAPGEAAGFLLLATEKVVNNEPLTALSPPGFGSETGHRYSEAPCKSEGATNAMAMAFEHNPNENIETVYSSHNGESFCSKELGVAITRNQKMLSESFTHEHPADCFGDIGAAFAPVLLGMVDHLPNTSASLIYCASDNEYRGVIVTDT